MTELEHMLVHLIAAGVLVQGVLWGIHEVMTLAGIGNKP